MCANTRKPHGASDTPILAPFCPQYQYHCAFFYINFPLIFVHYSIFGTHPAKKNAPESRSLRGIFLIFRLFLYLDNLYALVVAAGRAYAVGQLKGAALGAAAHSGSFQLPHIAASFVLSCFRAFSLRYCHLVFPPTLISLCFCQNISFPAACAVHPSGGRRYPLGSRTGPRSGSCRRSGTAPCSPPGTGSAGAAPAGCRW